MLRLAIAPDSALVPDVAAKLPGRGIWISASRAAIETGLKKSAFQRSAGRPVSAPDDLADLFETLLAKRALDLLGLARRAGDLAVGFDASAAALNSGATVWRIEASDAARHGRAKLDRLAGPDIPTAGCFTAEQLGAALGRSHVVHAVLSKGAQARSFGETMHKLSGFRALDPAKDGDPQRKPQGG